MPVEKKTLLSLQTNIKNPPCDEHSCEVVGCCFVHTSQLVEIVSQLGHLHFQVLALTDSKDKLLHLSTN